MLTCPLAAGDFPIYAMYNSGRAENESKKSEGLKSSSSPKHSKIHSIIMSHNFLFKVFIWHITIVQIKTYNNVSRRPHLSQIPQVGEHTSLPHVREALIYIFS